MSERPLTRNIRDDREPLGVQEYERAGGYGALRAALERMTPEDVQQLVRDSGLKGRGGAGFPTGQKWSFVPMGDDCPRPKYLVVNGDEMEPGTFKDRYLLEGDPHQFLEGVLLAAYAIQADVAYVFLRWAYKRAQRRVRRAIAEAREAGWIGRDVRGSGWDVEVFVHVSAGRYMAGEETGLLNALEGGRAVPRAKPPYPQVSGLFGKPTIVQNVETLCCLPGIVGRGAEWFRDLGLTEDAGTKLFGVSGRVRRPGLWELPMGTPVREVLEEHAGGMRDGLRLKGFLPGGASTDFLVEEHLDLPMDFGSIQDAGSRLGTAGIVVLDDGTCPVGMVRNLEAFFAQESCGWCTPCREGLPWTEKLLGALEEGRGRTGDLARLSRMCSLLGPGNTYCALAPGAVEPLQSALVYFEDDFRRHIQERGCPWRDA